ncbi:MAG: hypothetical protein GY934_20635 [Gammaproteobacteria bacterium]|nr:hypothetical protein [Gammaproteobacteria bacterium]
MQTSTTGIVTVKAADGWVKVILYCNPGPFPFGAPRTMGKAQYVGIADHLVLTLMEDRYLTGLLGHCADVTHTPSGHCIQWCGGVQAQPWYGDIVYKMHPLFIRDVEQLVADAKGLKLEARITGINGRVSNRQYWLVEIPAITPEVLLNIDEVAVVQRRKVWKAGTSMSSKITRGAFWQAGAAFQEDPVYEAKRQTGVNNDQRID